MKGVINGFLDDPEKDSSAFMVIYREMKNFERIHDEKSLIRKLKEVLKEREENITIEEYVEKAKKELDQFGKKWKEESAKDPVNWPDKMPEGEWGEQELASRFGTL